MKSSREDQERSYYGNSSSGMPPPAPPPRLVRSAQRGRPPSSEDYDEMKGEGSEIYVVDYVANNNQRQGRSRFDYDDDYEEQRSYYGGTQPGPAGSSYNNPPPPPPSSSMYYDDLMLKRGAPPPPTAPSSVLTTKSKSNRGVTVQTMAVPNPGCCPRGTSRRGVCCVLVLANLGLILITLGFSIVLQLHFIPFVWWCGLLFLIVGFIALLSSLIFLVEMCRHSRQDSHPDSDSEVYWTHLWEKRF